MPNPPPPRIPTSPIRFCTLLALATTSAVLLWLGFAVGGVFSTLAFIALVPLMLLVRLPAKSRPLYFAAYLGGFVFYALGVYWLGFAAPEWWQSVLMIGALAGYCAIYFPAFLVAAHVLNRIWGVPALFAFPIAWVALEWLRSTLLTGFGWLLVAHSLSKWTWTIQIADLGGAYAVSFLAVMVNAMIVELLIHPLMLRAKFDPTGNLRWRLLVTAAAIVGTDAYGWYRVGETDRIAKPGPRVVLLHSTLPQSVKDGDPIVANARVEKLAANYQSEKADLLVFPETSLQLSYGDVAKDVGDLDLAKLFIHRDVPAGPSADFPEDPLYGAQIRDMFAESRQKLLKIAKEQDKPILVSLLRRSFRQGRYLKYNSAVLTVPKEGEVGVYDKLHLVPFGEYLPLADSMPLLRHLMPYPPDVPFGLDHAERVKTIHYQNLHFGPLICFEDTVPWIARAMTNLADPSIDFFVNQSNDGWFKGSVEADYHLASSVFRCIENRKAMVRSTNIGVTCLVDAAGRVSNVHPRFEDGASVVTVPLDGRRTLYCAWGDWLPELCGLLLVGYVGATAVVVFRRTRDRIGAGIRKPTAGA